MMSTINICSALAKIAVSPLKQMKTSLPLTSFQKNALKRLKARENMIIKKKMDSFQFDTKHLMLNQIKFRLDSDEQQFLQEWLNH